MEIKKSLIYEDDHLIGIKFKLCEPSCDNCGTTDLSTALYALVRDEKITICSQKCAIEYCNNIGATYDFDCECNTDGPCKERCEAP